jgi:hypothetical protein
MLSRISTLFVFLLVTISIISTAEARYSSNPKLGINVGDLGKLTSSIPFTDIFKSSRGWFTSCEFDWGSGRAIDPGCTRKTSLNTREQDLLQLDGNGWVRSLPAPHEAPVYTSVTSTWKLSEHFPPGRYVVLYDGQGTLKLTGDLRMAYQKPGHIEFDLLSPKRNLRLQITRTDPRRNGEYLRNIRIVPKKNENNYRRQVFNKDYIARIRELHSLRFMPWTNPRANVAVEWNQRATIGSAFYTGDNGVPAERMVDLANAINASPWLSIPYKASDDYMHKFARMVKKRLRKNQLVYIEFSNEVWNSIFPAATYAARKADKLWNFPYPKVPQGKRRVLLGANWYAKRSVEMCQIWKKEFGGQRNRVKCVVGSLNSVPWVGKEILDCPLWKQANGCGRHIDAYGIGPYFGDYIARKEHRATVKSWTRNADGGKSRLFQEILHGGMLKNGPEGGAMAHLKTQLAQNKQLADKYNLQLIAYEAGQHLIRYDPPHTVKDPAVFNLFMSVQKDPRMRQAYQQYLDTWAQAGGGLMLHFYGIGQPEPKNFFGMLDHLHQQTTPKFSALMDYLGSPSTYVAPRKTYVPPVASTPRAPAPRPKQAAAPRTKQAPIRRQQPRATQQAATNNSTGVWDEFLVPKQQQQARQADVPVIQRQAPPQRRATTNAGIQGQGLRGWANAGKSAISPGKKLAGNKNHQLSVLWRYDNAQLRGNEFFRIYALDINGGRKILLEQKGKEIADMNTYDQLFEESINRYVGPTIRFMLEASPGLNVVVERFRF